MSWKIFDLPLCLPCSLSTGVELVAFGPHRFSARVGAYLDHTKMSDRNQHVSFCSIDFVYLISFL